MADTKRISLPANKVDAMEIKVGEELTVPGSHVKQEIADKLKDNLQGAGPAERKRPPGAPLKQYAYNLCTEQGKDPKAGGVPRLGTPPDTPPM